jgi:hypothetical protein
MQPQNGPRDVSGAFLLAQDNGGWSEKEVSPVTGDAIFREK